MPPTTKDCRGQGIIPGSTDANRTRDRMNCRPGDLAVTVKADLPENIGKIVRVISHEGNITWSGFREPTCMWKVSAASASCPLVYEYPDGKRIRALTGLVPDAFLRPIRPPFAGAVASAAGRIEEPKLENVLASSDA